MDAEKNKPIESTASQDAPSKKVGGVPKWKQRVRKMMWPLHARFPNHIANPYGDEKAYFLDRDAKENVETSLDDGVSLQLACIMVSEMFGPNEIDALYKGLAKIGWDRERVPIREGSNVDWLKDLRLYGKSGTLRLGWVHRNKDLKKYLGVRYTAEFPQDFSSLLVSISHLTPSTTCLTVGFVLNAEAALEYARAINEPANTTRVPQRRFRSYSIMSVEHVKVERIRNIRERYRKTAILWMKKSFPGYFAGNCEESRIPTVEFLTIDGFTPFDRDGAKNRSPSHWSRLVNIDDYFRVWTSSSVPALRFSLDSVRRANIPNHVLVAARCDGSVGEELKRHGGDSLESRVYFMTERLEGILAKYALASYVRELLRNLKETRQVLSIRAKAHRSKDEAEEISAFFRKSIGVPTIAREVLELSEDDYAFRWDAAGFTQHNPFTDGQPYEIKDAMKSFLSTLSQQLLAEDKDTREFLNQLSSAIGIKESILAQRRMEWIAWGALAVAVISAIVAAYATFGN